MSWVRPVSPMESQALIRAGCMSLVTLECSHKGITHGSVGAENQAGTKPANV